MAATLREMNTTPRTEPLSIEETIGLLVDREWTERENKRLYRLLKDARVPSGSAANGILGSPATESRSQGEKTGSCRTTVRFKMR